MPDMLSPTTVLNLAGSFSDQPLSQMRAAELAAELMRLNAAVRQAATVLNFDSAPSDFQRVLEAAADNTEPYADGTPAVGR